LRKGVRERPDLDGLGMVAQASVLRVGLGSASVTHGGPYNAVEAPEHSLGSPEASESENRGFQGLAARRVSRGFGDPIRDSDAMTFIDRSEGQDDKG
jgi:hypothetical protein